MDFLNTFILFNLSATVIAALAFALTRDGGVARLKAWAGDFNAAGAAGAVTSVAMLGGVVSLFY